MTEGSRRPVSRVSASATVISIALAAAALAISSSGCGGGRIVTAVELDPIAFENEAAPIPGAIELCITRELRRRQWNVRNHGHIIELGSRAALNVERLAKAAFESVAVSFDEACGTSTQRPRLSAVILSANREPDSLWARTQETSITMQFELVAADGTPIWSAETLGRVTKTPAPWTRRKIRAAEDFGDAMRLALERSFEEILASQEIRRAVASPSS